MTTYTGTQIVDPGLYYATQPFKLTSVDERGALPGAEDRTYRRVPMLIMMALAPLLGLAFVIFLPFIGFAMVARLAGEKAIELVGHLATQGARVLQPAWAPARAFLTRAKAAKPDTVASTPDPWAEDVERQLADTTTDTAPKPDTHEH
ncbi:MAG: hypothetical protein O2917_11005 [Acidobacteria bacterium]|nr:hypothetical protein [Acidobacteriota bacterium]